MFCVAADEQSGCSRSERATSGLPGQGSPCASGTFKATTCDPRARLTATASSVPARPKPFEAPVAHALGCERRETDTKREPDRGTRTQEADCSSIKAAVGPAAARRIPSSRRAIATPPEEPVVAATRCCWKDRGRRGARSRAPARCSRRWTQASSSLSLVSRDRQGRHDHDRSVDRARYASAVAENGVGDRSRERLSPPGLAGHRARGIA